ncbi:response regulator [Sphingomonas nostoxanthinifaciens]|uniref:response regulator n=1 Tax=Sphingomonas nostoxanthinifaciens TaxID=2872652 RepID=UPI001CC1EA8E|nr:response regulator [Sphingomonas nostoxanthinifaciens]UAK26155.1 response regulator [Sphingomonas nostoxanthinifaciens]
MTAPLRILVIEDEPLIAMMIEDYLDLLGHVVAGTADNTTDALARLDEGVADAAILDVNLRDGPCWRVADALSARDVPFVLATGGHVVPPPAAHADAPQLPKPFTLDGIKQALETLAAR